MPAEVARGNSVDAVQSPHGTGAECRTPAVYATDECSSKVRVDSHGVVIEGDAMQSHPNVGCVGHAPVLTSFSAKVRISGKGVGRKGDSYGGDHTILTGSSKVRVN